MEKQQPARFDIQRLTAEPAKAQTHKAQREITDSSLDVGLSNARVNPALGKSPTPGVLLCAFYLPAKFPAKAEQTSEQHMGGNCNHGAFLSPEASLKSLWKVCTATEGLLLDRAGKTKIEMLEKE